MRKFFRRIVLKWKLELLEFDYRSLIIDHDLHGIITFKQYEKEKALLDEKYDNIKAELQAL